MSGGLAGVGATVRALLLVWLCPVVELVNGMAGDELKGSIIAFCNPLLDITATVGADLLQRYSLEPNNAILAEPAHLPLYDELARDYQVLYTAGGSAQNTMRAAQWLLPAGSTVFVGCVGRDENGDRLRKVAQADGLQVEYLEDETAPTGTCACLISDGGRQRSLVANLGAANKYRLEHVLSPSLQEILVAAKIVYISGYFLTVSPATIMHVIHEARQREQIVCLNLSAPFICEFFLQPLLEALPHVDYLFGNEAEASILAKSLKLPGTLDLLAIGKHLVQMPYQGALTTRRVIITQGAEPTMVVSAEGDAQLFTVPPLAPTEIVDTNGAGDAFVGGFLSQLAQRKPLDACIRAGHYAAAYIIRRSGVTFDGKTTPPLEF